MKKIKIFNFLLIVICLILSFSFFINKSFENNILYGLYSNMVNHMNVFNKVETVSNSKKFINISDNIYYNEDYCVYSPKKGTVLFVSDDKIIIKCIDGYLAVFENLVNTLITKYDVITPNDKLANFISCFTFYFLKEEVVYSYEQIMGNT